MSFYYQALGQGRYAPTEFTEGAWSSQEQHMAPVSGLLVHALERHDPRPDLLWARLSFDILGMIHRSETQVRTRTLRPGRTIELVEAVASAGGRDVVRLTAWRLIASDTSAVAGNTIPALPDPEQLAPWTGMGRWSGGFISSLDYRAVGTPETGHGQVWLRPTHELVEGEESTEFARWAGLMDVANGIAVRAEPTEWLYPNVDLSLHLFRRPEGQWLGLDTQVSFGPHGQGLTSSRVHDAHGPVGSLAQSLTIRARPQG